MTRHPNLLPRLILMVATLVAAAGAAAQALEVIELRHRTADEVIPIIRPLLATGGVLTGTNYQLLVRTTPANLAQLRTAVAAIDRPPRQLRITVGQGTATNASSADVRGGATVGSDDVRVSVNRPPGGPTGADVRASAGTSSRDLRNVSSVQTLEGSETFISLGQSVPIRTTTVSPGRRGPVVQQTTDFQQVATGFFATARVNGDQVVLTVSPQQQRLRSGSGGVIETASVDSTVTGRLGQWIQLGAVSDSSSGANRGLLVWGRATASSQYTAWVKVDAAP